MGRAGKKQQIAGTLGASTKKCHVSQRWGKQPAPWHCWCTPVDSSTRPDFVHQGPHWIEAFDLSKVEGLTKRTPRCHLERYEQKNEEKEKRKIENLNVRPILRWFFWVDFLFSDRFLPDGFTVEQRPTESPPKGRLRNPRKVVPMSVTVHVPSQTSSIMGENYGNFFISWWKSKPVKFHWQKRSSSTEDFSPVPKLVINFSQLPNMSFVDEFHHFYTSFHDIFHRMVDNPQHRNLPCA